MPARTSRSAVTPARRRRCCCGSRSFASSPADLAVPPQRGSCGVGSAPDGALRMLTPASRRRRYRHTPQRGWGDDSRTAHRDRADRREGRSSHREDQGAAARGQRAAPDHQGRGRQAGAGDAGDGGSRRHPRRAHHGRRGRAGGTGCRLLDRSRAGGGRHMSKEKTMSANQKLLDYYVERYMAGDLDAFMDLYADDAVQAMPDGFYQGRAAIRERLAREVGGAFSNLTWTVDSFVE